MRHILLFISSSLLILTICLLPSERSGAEPLNAAPNPSAIEVLDAINSLRSTRNLPPYQVNSILMIIAQSHADYISSTGVVSHFNTSGTPPYKRAIDAGYSVAGDLSQGGLFSEIIGTGKELSAEGVISLWQENPRDLGTLLSPDLKDVGVGMKTANGVNYYVLDAGASNAEPLASSTVVATVTLFDRVGTQEIPILTNTPLDDGTIYHMVQANEALWSIALAYDTTVEQLKLLNSLSTDDIYEGQKILIRRPVVQTATPEIIVTATFGIPTSTVTRPVTSTVTSTNTPMPIPPTSRQTGGVVLGAIIAAALLAAGIGSWLGRRNKSK